MSDVRLRKRMSNYSLTEGGNFELGDFGENGVLAADLHLNS